MGNKSKNVHGKYPTTLIPRTLGSILLHEQMDLLTAGNRAARRKAASLIRRHRREAMNLRQNPEPTYNPFRY